MIWVPALQYIANNFASGAIMTGGAMSTIWASLTIWGICQKEEVSLY